jgi:Rieske Fe-S protein
MREDFSPGAWDWLDTAPRESFLAWLTKWTHFCCVPSFKGTDQALKYEAGNQVYCPCHQSVYDPTSIVQETFVALPRPGD